MNYDNVRNPEAYERATRMRIIMNARTTFTRTYPDAPELINFVYDEADRGNQFMRSMMESLDNYGKLSLKQVECVRNSIARKAQWKAESEAKISALNAKRTYVGTVGEKIELKLTCKKHILFQGTKFSYYSSGIGHIYICEDENGNVVKYSGSADFLEEGESGIVRGKVKSQVVYNGCPQTSIKNPKVLPA